MKPYPAYKDSGIEWLGQVPEGWQVTAPKRYIKSQSGGTTIKGQCADEPADGLVPGFSASGQDVWLEDYQFDTSGLVLSAVGARCGKTFKADGKWGTVANTHCLFPDNNSCRNFIWYLTNNEDWWEKGGTAQPFVSVRETLNRSWAFPPLPEQQAIAAFLDRETAKIDGLIEEQRRLIALLAEKRQATISHAVTRGLNPSARLKPSGVDWLGDIPEGWDVVHLRRLLSSVFNGTTATQVEESEGTVPVTRIETISGGAVNFDKVGHILVADAREEMRLKAGDILFSHINSLNVIGNCAIIRDSRRLYAGMNLLTLRPCEGLYPEWLHWMLSSQLFRRIVSSRAKPAINQASIPQSSLLGIHVLLPPIIDQKSIAAYLNKETARLDALTETATAAIALLQERRAALISAAVTGKIDVRDLATVQEAA